MKEEILINTQFALFFDQPIIKPEELWQLLNTGMGGVFDSTPLILPVPNEPNLYDVPVVQMGSVNGKYRCNIARNRVDFFIAGVGRQKFSDIKNDLISKAESYYNLFAQKAAIKRIGFVERIFVEDDHQNETIERLIDNDFKALHEGSVYESFIRHSTRIKIESLDVNSIIFIEKFSARIGGIGDSVKGILATFDFSTMPEENYKDKFDVSVIKKFLETSEAKIKLGEIKRILWPENQSNQK